jgi:hypothetical protein
MITSFAGLVERFSHPDLTLYYTLTRKRQVVIAENSDEASGPENQDEAGSLEHSDEAGKRVLYITIFDHKERTTRVYTRDGTTERLYSTESDVPLIDLRHGLLETKLCNKIISKDDLIAGDPEIHALLRMHYQSIMNQIHFTIGETHNKIATPPPPRAYAIENKWTLEAADTVGAPERSRREETVKHGLGRTWEFTVERGRTTEVDGLQPTFERDRLYLDHGRIEEMRQSLDVTRGQWIDRYMQSVTREVREQLKGETTAMRRVDGEQAGDENMVEKRSFSGDEDLEVVVEERLIYERCLMEKLLVHEVEAWEGLVWNRVKEFIGRNDVPESEKVRLTREWRGNCWKRLDANIRAMDTRMERVKAKISALPSNTLQRTLNVRLEEAHDEIREAWQSVIERLVDTPTPSVSSTPSSRFNRDVRRRAERNEFDRDWGMTPPAQQEQERQYLEIARQLKKELADVQFRIAQGLDRCDEFFDDEKLFASRHARSKSLILDSDRFKAPLDFYARALQSNNDVIRIDFLCYSDEEYAWCTKTVCDLSSVTSIFVSNRERLPPIQRDTPLFIDHDDSESLETFLNNDQSLARTRDTYVFMQYKNGWTIAVSFVGPSSGNLRLRLKHYADRYETTLTVVGTSFSLAVPELLAIDDINLHPDSNSSSQLSFKPNTRNKLILQASSLDYYNLQDIQLLNEDGKPYGQPPQRNIPAEEVDALGMSDDQESS